MSYWFPVLGSMRLDDAEGTNAYGVFGSDASLDLNAPSAQSAAVLVDLRSGSPHRLLNKRTDANNRTEFIVVTPSNILRLLIGGTTDLVYDSSLTIGTGLQWLAYSYDNARSAGDKVRLYRKRAGRRFEKLTIGSSADGGGLGDDSSATMVVNEANTGSALGDGDYVRVLQWNRGISDVEMWRVLHGASHVRPVLNCRMEERIDRSGFGNHLIPQGGELIGRPYAG